MGFVESVQLELPASFPSEPFSRFINRARAVLLPDEAELWTEFAGAFNLIAWRFRSAGEHCEAYQQSWTATGAHADFEELYERERSMFGMLTSGVSAVDATCYAVWALSSHASIFGLRFGEYDRRRCGPKTRSWLHYNSSLEELREMLWPLA
jgi:hypothetical protein